MMRTEIMLSEVLVFNFGCQPKLFHDIIQTREEMMRDELSHKRTLELAQAQSSVNPLPVVRITQNMRYSLLTILKM